MRFIVDECTGVAVVEYLRRAGHDVLAVADNLARATESLDPEARAAADGTFKALLDGIGFDGFAIVEHDLFPCVERDESRFSPDFEVPLTSLEIQVAHW